MHFSVFGPKDAHSLGCRTSADPSRTPTSAEKAAFHPAYGLLSFAWHTYPTNRTPRSHLLDDQIFKLLQFGSVGDVKNILDLMICVQLQQRSKPETDKEG